MGTVNGKLKLAILCMALYACGTNSSQDDGHDLPSPPPPSTAGNFDGLYKEINVAETDSIVFMRIWPLGKLYHVARYTWVVKEDSLYDRGWDGIDFSNESAHRLIAANGYASISNMETEGVLWYVNKPADYRLKKVCELPKTNTFADIKKALTDNKAIPH